MKTDVLEYAAMGSGARVDRSNEAAPVVQNVKILGLESKNGRVYSPSAVQGAVELYEGAKVNVNHPAGSPSQSRDYRDRIGYLRNVNYREGLGLFGDLHFNPKHALAEQLAWDAEHAPENVGLSHNINAQVVERNGKRVVESILNLRSVDLVGDPATTKGLFESEGYMDGMTATPEQGGTPDVRSMMHAGIDKILDGDGEPAGKASAIKKLVFELLKVEQKLDAALAGNDTTVGSAESPEAKQADATADSAAILEELNALKSEKRARELLEAAHVACKPEWIAAVAALTEAQRPAFVASLPKQVAQSAARSMSGVRQLQESTFDPKSFANSLRQN